MLGGSQRVPRRIVSYHIEISLQINNLYRKGNVWY